VTASATREEPAHQELLLAQSKAGLPQQIGLLRGLGSPQDQGTLELSVYDLVETLKGTKKVALRPAGARPQLLARLGQ
jgi:hypothetical protein